MDAVATGILSVQATMLKLDQWVDLPVQAVHDAHGEDALDFVERRRRNPARAARLMAMRERIGKALAKTQSDVPSLVAFRLRAGLSQQQLAERMGTKQPSVARWERDPSSMLVGTMRRLAEVLGVDLPEMLQAVCAHAPQKESADV
jgi:ribosome-binding protein aMBF1 (putative translation factor)